MRVFLCSYKSFSLAIPIESVSLITLHTGNAEKKIEFKNENRNTYISLPLLLNSPQDVIKHGIILKNINEDQDNDVFEDRTILLTTEIECETEIDDENIYSIPHVFKITRFSYLFSGIFFYSQNHEGGLILLMNPKQLIQNLKKELIT